jgi:hypothetical protein
MLLDVAGPEGMSIMEIVKTFADIGADLTPSKLMEIERQLMGLLSDSAKRKDT